MQTFLGGGMAFKAPQTASHAGVAGGESLQKEKKCGRYERIKCFNILVVKGPPTGRVLVSPLEKRKIVLWV